MNHQQVPSSQCASPGRWRRVSAAAAAVVLSAFTGAADCSDDVEVPTCQANCAVEVECDFRTQAACEEASCNPITGAVLNGSLDACLGAASDCLEAAACPCSDGCAKVEECSGSPDPTCEADCDTLVDQVPKATYQENACRIESSCEDLAVCSSVSG